MAIVKFVSDKDCQIFIDMELAGKVTSESMLKVTLETGGYIIQIKDGNGNLIKEYDLEIKPSDNQLLQKIDSANNKQDDIIENLKNDSSLVFHCDRASFCLNGLYGFVDKKLNVVIPPIYYSVNDFNDEKAFVVRDFPEGRKATMIDIDGNIYFNQWYNYIGESTETILFGLNDKIIVFSKKEYKKKGEYFNAGYDFKEPLVPAYKKVDNSYLYGFLDFKGNEVIPFVFDKVCNFNEKGESDIIFLGQLGKINKNGFFKYIWDLDSEGYTGWKNDPEWIRDMLQEYEYLFYPWEYTCYFPNEHISWIFLPVWINNKWNIKISVIITDIDNSNKIVEERLIDCDRVLDIGEGYCVCKIGEKVNVIVADVRNFYLFDFWYDADEVQPIITKDVTLGEGGIAPISFIIKKNNNFGLINIRGELIIPIEYDSITHLSTVFSRVCLFCLKKAENCSIFNLEKESFFPTQYENVDAIVLSVADIMNFPGPIIDDCDTIYLRVNYNGKYGLLLEDGKEILPPLYKSINCDKNVLIVQQYNKYSFGNIRTGELYQPFIYDRIFVLKDRFVILEKDNKQGCSTPQGRLLLPVQYDKISLLSTFDSFHVIIEEKLKKGCIDEKGNVLLQTIYDDIIFYSHDLILQLILKIGDRFGIYERFGFGEIDYLIFPEFDECVFINRLPNKGHLLYPHIGIRKGDKWAVVNQEKLFQLYLKNNLDKAVLDQPAYKNFHFTYNSLKEVISELDNS